MSIKLPTGLRVRELRVDRGWTQDELAERIDTTKATISKLERSTKGLSEAWMNKLAEAFDMSVPELLGGAAPTGPRIRDIPLIGQIAAGNWREAVEEPIGHVPAIDPPRNAFALEPVGDSMNLVIPVGAYAVIDPDDTDLRDGKIYAVRNGEGEATLKMYRSEPARLEPRSTNPEHQPMKLGAHPFTIIGRVTMTMQRH